jgi:hypothetical protein
MVPRRPCGLPNAGSATRSYAIRQVSPPTIAQQRPRSGRVWQRGPRNPAMLRKTNRGVLAYSSFLASNDGVRHSRSVSLASQIRRSAPSLRGRLCADDVLNGDIQHRFPTSSRVSGPLSDRDKLRYELLIKNGRQILPRSASWSLEINRISRCCDSLKIPAKVRCTSRSSRSS